MTLAQQPQRPPRYRDIVHQRDRRGAIIAETIYSGRRFRHVYSGFTLRQALMMFRQLVAEEAGLV